MSFNAQHGSLNAQHGSLNTQDDSLNAQEGKLIYHKYSIFQFREGISNLCAVLELGFMMRLLSRAEAKEHFLLPVWFNSSCFSTLSTLNSKYFFLPYNCYRAMFAL